MECMKDNFSEGVLLDGRFETISPLNHGSFGMVFMAKDTLTGETVAVKCLTKPTVANACPSALSVDDRSEELACHARLGSHPNIVNMIHHFESDSHIYLVLEFCSMGDLYEAIRLGRGPRETDNVRDFMLQLVDAVGYMHSKGMYHRDIKPENIFLTSSGDMKLGDFGLATIDSWSYENTVGSDRYMSPEQYDSAGTGYSTEEADVWAIGICLLNLLFSRNPFATPTEADPLFADYIRDRQSLFDIFPTMSQDTFEVLSYAMAIDSEKRSLDALREALGRVVSFTTDDESLDDFCTEDHDVVPASANREPLRTPSIQSPHVEQGASFPWAKALRMSPPQQIRQLSAIAEPDESSSVSEASKDDFYSLAPETHSVASALDSGLGASLKSLAIRRPDTRHNLPRSEPMPISGSMPIPATKSMPAMASVFGNRRDLVSKSWSDLWDEEEEATAEHAEESEDVSNEWEQDNTTEDVTVRPTTLAEASSSTLNKNINQESKVLGFKHDGAQEEDVFYFEDQHLPRYSPPPRYTPPSRRDIMDKWAALGDRRRAYNSSQSSPRPAKNRSAGGEGRREFGLGFLGFDGGAWDGNEREKGWEFNQRDGGDLEWVGGWHDLNL